MRKSRRDRSLDNLLRLLPICLLFLSPLAIAYSSPPTVDPGTAAVSIHNFAFSPSTTTVVIGVNSTVTWTNNDSTAHTVTADDSSFDSGQLSPGGTYSHTFASPGTYSYHCSIHTYMKGTIKVVAGSSGTTQNSTGGSSGGIPEFPFEGLALVVVTAIVLASYVALRRTRK